MRRPLNKTKLTVYISKDTMSRLDLLTINPLRQKIKYGMKSLVVERLLERWLAGGGRLEELGL